MSDPSGSGARKTLPASMLEWWRPLLIAIGLCALVIITRPSDNVDRQFSDLGLVSQATAPDDDLAIVEITAEDTRRFGGQPIPRHSLATLIGALADAGASRIYLDMNLGEPIEGESDAQLAKAFAQLGPERIALGSGMTVADLPAPIFREHVTILDSRLANAADGWHRSVGIPEENAGLNPAAWLADGTFGRGELNLDLRVAHWDVPRLSMSDVIDGRAALEGRTVVVGLSSSYAPTRTFLPIAGESDRAGLLMAGVQSARGNYIETEKTGSRANMALQIFAIFLGLVCGLVVSSGRKLIMLGAAVIVFLFATNVTLVQKLGAPAQPSTAIFCFLVMVNVTLVQRLRIVPMISSFLRGDLSPDEALAWRALEPQKRPVILFGADGRIKRANAAADRLAKASGEEIARQCLPDIGSRGTAVTIAEQDGRPGSFRVEWPYPDVSIAILEDRTAGEELAQSLQRQLEMDELTGCANRRGFERATSQAAAAGEGYAIFFVDMDGFKAINDTHGHEAGDELLKTVATRISGMARQSDCFARLGGDEFALLVSGSISERAAEKLARRVETQIAVPVYLQAAGTQVVPGASVGFARQADPGESKDAVLRRADQAMYRRKAANCPADRAA